METCNVLCHSRKHADKAACRNHRPSEITGCSCSLPLPMALQLQPLINFIDESLSPVSPQPWLSISSALPIASLQLWPPAPISYIFFYNPSSWKFWASVLAASCYICPACLLFFLLHVCMIWWRKPGIVCSFCELLRRSKRPQDLQRNFLLLRSREYPDEWLHFVVFKLHWASKEGTSVGIGDWPADYWLPPSSPEGHSLGQSPQASKKHQLRSLTPWLQFAFHPSLQQAQGHQDPDKLFKKTASSPERWINYRTSGRLPNRHIKYAN